MNSAPQEQTVAKSDKVVQENGKEGSNEGSHQVHVDANLSAPAVKTTARVNEYNSDLNTTLSTSNYWNKSKVWPISLSEKIIETFGSTVAYCVKPHGKEEVRKSGKIAVIIESDGTKSTEEVVWKESHHKSSHSDSRAANNDVRRRPVPSNITQPATNKNNSTA